MKSAVLFRFGGIVMLALGACTPGPVPGGSGGQGGGPYAAQPGDAALMRGDIRVDSASLRIAESMPVQVFLDFGYFQPTPCFELRVAVSRPDAQGRIDVKAYAVAEKDKPCPLMALATPLQATVPLGSFPPGHYRVWLNGVEVGEFDS